MKTYCTNIFILTITALLTLVVKAYIFLPIPQRMIMAKGLYSGFNNVQFIETAAFTFVTIFVVAYFKLRLKLFLVGLLAMAFTSINFGIMVIDARWQSYNEWIEQEIVRLYGASSEIYTTAVLAVIGGALIIAISAIYMGFYNKEFQNGRS